MHSIQPHRNVALTLISKSRLQMDAPKVFTRVSTHFKHMRLVLVPVVGAVTCNDVNGGQL